jgi:hypothetical protein
LVVVSGANAGLVEVDAVVKPAFFRRLLICRPSSSSEDVKPGSESDAGGGLGSLFLILDFAFVVRFLNETTGTSAAT